MADNDKRDDEDADLDRWLDTLAGRTPRSGSPPADPASDREALALRDAVLRHAAKADAARPPPADARAAEDHAWQRLAFRLRREGLSSARPKLLARPWVPAAAAAMLMLGIGVNLYMGASSELDFAINEREAPQFRDAAVPIIETTAAQPVPAAQRLAIAARRLGAAPMLYAFDGKAVLDLEVPAPQVEALRQAFERNKVPADKLQAGLVRVVFTARP